MADNRIAATATPIPENEDLNTPAELLRSGMALQKAGTPFVTAITVQKPRNLDKVVAAMDREAEYAGKTFWYSWRDKKGNLIEGPSIGLANSLAREWTNCGVTVDFQETADTFIITPRFIDIEKGFQSERVFRQHKGVVQGNFDPERKLDMALQIGQSKAIRNVVCNAVPKWLVQRAIEKAKQAVVKGIDPKKLTELKKEIHEFFHERGITPEQLVAKAKRPMAEWTTMTIAAFQADMHAVETGEVSADEIFPSKESLKTPDGPIDGKKIAEGLEKARGGATSEPLVSTDVDQTPETDTSGMSDDEKLRARNLELQQARSKAFTCTACNKFSTDDKAEFDIHRQKEHPAPPVQQPKKPNGGKPATGQGSMFGS